MILKQKAEVREVIGMGRGLENLEKAKSLGIVDSYTQDLEIGVRGADVVVVATPVCSITKVISIVQPHMKAGAIITDVGSVKGGIVREVEEILDSRLHFVGGHPIAGTEQSGAEAAFPSLYEGSRCIITPTDRTDKQSLAKIKEMWTLAEAEVVLMDVDDHDKILAAVSHLPHLVAYALVNTVDGINDFNVSILKYSAGGFKDFTRIASSSPEMWRDICVMNRAAIIDMTDRYMAELGKIKTAMESNDFDSLYESFKRSKEARDSI